MSVAHEEWRRGLHVPEDAFHNPSAGKYSVTKGKFDDGEEFALSDYWRASTKPDRDLSRRWKGTTTFTHGPEVDESGAPNSAARWLTQRGP